ncbi:MAG: homoserine dehydrogenase [Canidatus Methanoxibalbensis ujae]|nr:homoserine dehydrogenase [Candidatus Methanoxibalbensis ujae]MCW7077955.1 homoserine dehydrogenase [Candidatus Methanoxibalbensis ujae]RLG36868.1 MAG: homoserine dehydrogenase [Methanosarcinales archaeon]
MRQSGKVVRITIIGFGNVGGCVAEVLMRRREAFIREYGIDFRVVGVADAKGVFVSEDGIKWDILRSFRERHSISRNTDMSALELIEDVEHDIVVEATPTNLKSGEPGLSHIIAALRASRHVVTSNKGPVALKYDELMNIADAKGVQLRFEATVGGAMPLISLIQNLEGNEVTAIKGVLNGTCNYILTRMYEEKIPFEHALREAQALGIAESDPSQDISGEDTAVKLVILANAVFHMKASLDDVSVQGISEITPEALKLADDAGYTIKLVGEVSRERLEVAPRLVLKGDPLDVRGTLNVATVKTDIAGDITIVGKGAGPKEAASAVLSDMLKICTTEKLR